MSNTGFYALKIIKMIKYLLLEITNMLLSHKLLHFYWTWNTSELNRWNVLNICVIKVAITCTEDGNK